MPEVINATKAIAPRIENPAKPMINIKRADKDFSLKEV